MDRSRNLSRSKKKSACSNAWERPPIIIMLIESGHVGEYKNLADMGLTAMIVVLAVSLVGSLFYKTKKK